MMGSPNHEITKILRQDWGLLAYASFRASCNPPAATTISAILMISPGMNGSAPRPNAALQLIPRNSASQPHPLAKITASPVISAPMSGNPARREPPSRKVPIFALRSTSHPVTNAAAGYENKYPAVGPANRASPGSP